jgi:glycerol-3-phosphate acyltransferase PlsY
MSGFELVLRFVAVIVVGYVIGSVPSGVLVGRAFGNVDPRSYGSGKTGATNVLRTLGPTAAALVVVGDLLKGVLAVLFARFIFFGALVPFPIHVAGATQHMLAVYQPWAEALAGLAAVLGHTYSIFINFTGGRGVLTGAGVVLVLTPFAFLVGLIGAIIPITLTRYVSLGSIVGGITLTVTELILVLKGLAPVPYFLFTLFASIYVIALHKDNIERLLNGTERKLGQRAG